MGILNVTWSAVSETDIVTEISTMVGHTRPGVSQHIAI